MARILIANDDCDLLELCRSFLEDEGHLVDIVANGEEAVARLRTWMPDLVVMDWVMPEMDGGTAVEKLRAHPATASMPVLMMSGSDDGEARSLAAGADSFLRKPFRGAELVNCVADLLRSTSGIARPTTAV